MSRKKELKDKRNASIKARHKELSSKRISKDENSTLLYRHVAILEILSQEFYLATETIERIVNKK